MALGRFDSRCAPIRDSEFPRAIVFIHRGETMNLKEMIHLYMCARLPVCRDQDVQRMHIESVILAMSNIELIDLISECLEDKDKKK